MHQHQGLGSMMMQQHQGLGSMMMQQHQGLGSMMMQQHQGLGSMMMHQHEGLGSMMMPYMNVRIRANKCRAASRELKESHCNTLHHSASHSNALQYT